MQIRKRCEHLFLLLCLAIAAGCIGLAFWYAVPLQAASRQTLPDGQPLTTYIQVDLNTADISALCTLPGVGEHRAEAILAYRAANGPFVRVEDAVQVPGITQEIVDSWTGQVYVSG